MRKSELVDLLVGLDPDVAGHIMQTGRLPTREELMRYFGSDGYGIPVYPGVISKGYSEKGLIEFVGEGNIIHLSFELRLGYRFRIKGGNTFVLTDGKTGHEMDRVRFPYFVDKHPQSPWVNKENGILNVSYKWVRQHV